MKQSTILKSLARSFFTPGILLILTAIVRPPGVLAQQYPSARIESLGGSAITGIIPDTLTDIYLNPAYLHRCSRLTINFGQRRTDEFSMRFPRVKMQYWSKRFLSRDYLNSHNATEITLYGIPLGSWKVGLSAAWYLDYEDDSDSEYSAAYYSFYNISQVAETFLNHSDLHNYRIDLSVSSELSSGTVLGLRVGGFQRTYAHSNTSQRLSYDFDIDEGENEIYLDRKDYRYSNNNDHRRISSFFLQAGLLSGKGQSEKSLYLQVAREEIYGRTTGQLVNSYTNYDSSSDPYRYDYGETYYRDERSGALWRYDVRGRFSLPHGIRVFAGGGFERMRYDTDWFDRDSEYEWRDGWEDEEVDKRISLEFGDEGDHEGFSLFLKAGRATELRYDLKLTVGLHGYMRWMRSEENPVTLITVYSCIDSTLITFPMERPILISTESTLAGFSLPLAIEYEPARWISIWSGFRIYANYTREKDWLPNILVGDLLNFLDPSLVDSYLHQEGSRSVEDIDISSTGTIGLSLHYRDRFFVDIYSGSDLTPEDITRYILDVRYAF